MSEAVRDSDGKIRQLQDCNPLPRPSGADHDCAYCSRKRSCVSAGRQFFVGDAYPVCPSYADYAAELDEDWKRSERLKELSKITDPVPRPEGEAPDCLYCKMLPKQSGLYCHNGPWQGAGRTCKNYSEATKRPENAPQHCIYCLNNFNCSRGRVLRIGKPCERYKEVLCG